VHIRGHRGVVLADSGCLVSAAHAGAELAGALGEQPRLRLVMKAAVVAFGLASADAWSSLL
jgi:hypothetical protein